MSGEKSYDVAERLEDIFYFLSENKIQFPLLLVPWCAESSGEPSYIVRDYDELLKYGPEAFARCHNTVLERIHIFERKGYGKFYLDHTGPVPNRRYGQ